MFHYWLLLEKFGVWFDTSMTSGNLPDGGHDKVTWKRSRDLLTRPRDNVTPRRGGGVPQRCYWVFHLRLVWDVAETYRWNIVVIPLETLSWRPDKTLLRSTTEMSWRRSIETSLGVSFKTYLRMFLGRTGRRCNDVVMTSSRGLVAGWVDKPNVLEPEVAEAIIEDRKIDLFLKITIKHITCFKQQQK